MSIDKAIENLKSVRLKGGIFGKTTLLLIVLAVCVSAVALKSNLWWLTLALMLPLIVVVLYALKRSFDFASDNPHAAIMDGAELLQHERIVYAVKDIGILIGEAPTTEMPIQQIPEIDPGEQDLPEDNGQRGSDA
jgi:hypothetical protein